MKILSTQNAGVEALKIAIYGKSGIGKTTLAGTAGEPTLIVSAEAGLLSLKGKTIDVIDISRADDGSIIPPERRIARLTEVYKYLLLPETQAKYKWVFVDSLTEISQLMIAHLSTVYPDRKDSLPLYGDNLKKMQAIIKSFRDLPGYNVVMTALVVTEKDENNVPITGIDLVGKISDKLPGFFDEVFYYHADKDGKRWLRTQPTDRVVAKDRSGMLEPLIEVKKDDMTLQKIAQKIRGAVEVKPVAVPSASATATVKE